MVGLPPSVASRRPADWFDRVHADDIEPLKQALGEHLSGQTDHVQLEHRVRHEDGTYRGFLCRGVAVRDAQGRATRIAGSMTDTERAVAQDRLRSGFRDPLTGLCNRSVFVERLGQRLQDFKQHRRGRFATLYLDLDRFKLVNDSLGHLVGDDLLIAVSRRLESCLRPGDALARLGGDEFAILLDGLVEPTQANAIAFRIQDTLSAPFAIGGREVFTSASIGIAFCLTDYTNPEEIMRDADTAMYHAKARGKSRHEMFDADMHAQALDRLGLEDDLRHAVKDNDFELHYQPIVTLASGMCVGFEALVRWKRNGQAVSPAHVHSRRRGAGADRAARDVGAPGGLPQVRGLAAAVPGSGTRMHHRQRVHATADAAEFPRTSSSRPCRRPGCGRAICVWRSPRPP